MMNSKQFAWLYLIENGIAGVSHSFYGGYDLVDKRMQRLINTKSIFGQFEKIKPAYLEEIKTIGVDWKKTYAPDSDTVTLFNGTFAEEHDRKEILTGTLILKNGLEQTWSADAIEVTNVFEMMATLQDSINRGRELFGEE